MDRDQPYDDDFARYYDLLIHREKDAELETEELLFLDWAFREVAKRKVKSVLDVGCGTGRHVIPLSRLGLRVSGMDQSSGMIRECRKRIRREGLQGVADAFTGDMTQADYGGPFDAIICMDSCFDYLPDVKTGQKVLEHMREVLRPGGLAVIDSWDYRREWEMELQYPETSTQQFENVRIEYSDRHELDEKAGYFRVNIKATIHENRRSRTIVTRHALRLTSVRERKQLMRDAGFSDVHHFADFNSRKPLRGGPCKRFLCTGIRSK